MDLAAVLDAWTGIGGRSDGAGERAYPILRRKPGKQVSVLVEVVLRAWRPIIVRVESATIGQSKRLRADIEVSIEAASQSNWVAFDITTNLRVVIAEVVVEASVALSAVTRDWHRPSFFLIAASGHRSRERLRKP